MVHHTKSACARGAFPATHDKSNYRRQSMRPRLAATICPRPASACPGTRRRYSSSAPTKRVRPRRVAALQARARLTGSSQLKDPDRVDETLHSLDDRAIEVVATSFLGSLHLSHGEFRDASALSRGTSRKATCASSVLGRLMSAFSAGLIAAARVVPSVVARTGSHNTRSRLAVLSASSHSR